MPTYTDIDERDRIKILTEMMTVRAKHIELIKKLLHPVAHHVAIQIEWELRAQMPPMYGK